jgi:hypothetical protein
MNEDLVDRIERAFPAAIQAHAEPTRIQATASELAQSCGG